VSRRAPCLALAALLLSAGAAGQLDPAACKQARKELATVAGSAAFEHRVQVCDASVELGFALALPLVDAELDSFDADSVDALRDALDAWVRGLEQASLYAAGLVRDQLPAVLSGAFGATDMYGRLPPGFLPGDGGVLDDFRARLARRQATAQKAVDKALVKSAAWVRQRVDVQLELQVLAPEIAWVAGNRDGAQAGLAVRAPLDVLVAARSDTLVLVGTRLALAGHADDGLGPVDVQLADCQGEPVAQQQAVPTGGRWAATFADVDANPVLVRVRRGAEVLAERCVGFP